LTARQALAGEPQRTWVQGAYLRINSDGELVLWMGVEGGPDIRPFKSGLMNEKSVLANDWQLHEEQG